MSKMAKLSYAAAVAITSSVPVALPSTVSTNAIVICDERYGDLFTVPEIYKKGFAFVNCVSADLEMSRGVSRIFYLKYGEMENLYEQNPSIGNIVYLFPYESRPFIFHLVTKYLCYETINYESLEICLEKLCKLCIKHSITTLAMTRLVCRLKWDTIKKMIIGIFKKANVSIHIIIYHF